MSIMKVAGIGNLNAARIGETSTGSVDRQSSGSFRQLLESAVENVERYQREARLAVEEFLKGEETEIHEVALKAQRAALVFDLALEVRNKVVEAYKEIMRMQV